MYSLFLNFRKQFISILSLFLFQTKSSLKKVACPLFVFKKIAYPFFIFSIWCIPLLGADLLVQCGFFPSALTTREACTTTDGGVIRFDGSANIYGNPDVNLTTCTVTTPQWVLDQTQTCESGDCIALPGNGLSESINYSNPPTTASLNASPSNSNTNMTINANITLGDYRYDTINFNYEGVNKTATFQQSGNNKKTLVVNSITNAWNLRFKDTESIEIGSITSADYNQPFSMKNDAIPQDIAIKTIDFKDQSAIDLNASNTIKIESLSVGRGGSNIILKAPTLTINTLNLTSYGSGNASITLYGDTINIGTLNLGQDATVTVYPYTQGGTVLYKGTTITASSSSSMIVSTGDYYVTTFSIPGTSNASSFRALNASSIINLFINGNFSPGNNPGINSNGNNGAFGDLPSTSMRIFINGDLNTGGGGTTINAIIYAEGDVTLGNPTYIRGAISAEDLISIGEGSKIYYDNNISLQDYGACDSNESNVTAYSQGVVDIVDNYSQNGYVAQQGLHTKVASSSGVYLDAVWLGINGGTSPVSYYTPENRDVVDMPVLFYFYSINTIDDNATCAAPIGQILNSNDTPIVAILSAGDIYKRSTSSFTMPSTAKKGVKIMAKFINFYGMNILDRNITCLINSSNDGNIEGMPQCVNSENQYKQAFGNAAVQRCRTANEYGAPCEPRKHGIGTREYNHIYGCYQCTLDALSGTSSCSTDAFAIRPNNFNSSINSGKIFIAESAELDANIIFYANRIGGVGTTDYNETIGTSFVVDVNISDTNKDCVQRTINLTPSIIFGNGSADNNYSFSNVGDFNLTIHEINGSEYALIDNNDTPDNNRFISPHETNISVIPASFDLNATFLNQSDGFTYLANSETNNISLEMAAHLDLNISVLGSNGGILTNYSSTCYAKDSNLTIHSGDVNITGLNKLLWYHNDTNDTLDTNGSILLPFSEFKIPLNHTQFDGNGTTQIEYLINFDRNSTTPVNPFKLTIKTIDNNDTDANGTSPDINDTVTFYYGRVHAPDYRGPSPITATIYYEAYCKNVNCSAFDINGSESPDSIYWYRNTLHVNINNDGNVSSFSPLGSTNVTVPSPRTINLGAETITLSHTPPYVDKIEMTPSPWLTFTPSSFNVEFIATGNWAGEGSVDRNTSNNVGKFTNEHNVTRSNRRLNW